MKNLMGVTIRAPYLHSILIFIVTTNFPVYAVIKMVGIVFSNDQVLQQSLQWKTT